MQFAGWDLYAEGKWAAIRIFSHAGGFSISVARGVGKNEIPVKVRNKLPLIQKNADTRPGPGQI